MVRASLLFVALLCVGCDSAKTPQSGLPCSPVTYDYSGGVPTVCYFPCIGANFGVSLEKYINDHPGLRVVSVAGSGTGGYGMDVGYWVITEPKQDPCKCQCCQVEKPDIAKQQIGCLQYLDGKDCRGGCCPLPKRVSK